MTDIGRYRKIYPRIWRHPGFRQLSETAQRIALYVLTGPQTNRIGLFCFSIATAAEDINVSVETFRKRLPDVLATFGWHFDAAARVMFVRSWWRWNHPENPNVLQGNLKDLNDVPPCALVDAFVGTLETLDPTLHQTFVECCPKHLHKRSSNQEQYQDLHKQEQKHRKPKTAKNENHLDPTSVNAIDSRLDTVMAEASKHFHRADDIDLKLDTIREFLPQAHLTRDAVSRQQLIAALARHEARPS